ncbi:MAG TPA: cytochrome P450 [Thermoleophilaceae bacterium]|nr:cytochrome P450 [Thermoleophilaceae bacterium]
MTEPALPPGPRLPRPAQTLGWVTRPGPFLARARRRYGDTFSVKIAQEGNWVMLTDPDDVQQVFTGDPRLLHAGAANVILLPLLGHHSVLLLDGERHMAQRKLLLPPFHGKRMRGYEDLMKGVAQQELERWPRGEPFPLWPRMQAVTLEVIIRAVFGVRGEDRLERMRTRLREALEITTDMRSFLAVAALGPQRVSRMRFFQRELDPVNEALLDEIRDRRGSADLDQRDDILSMLLTASHEDGSPMSDQELRDELMTLLVAGHETTATALAWAMERLVRHPDMLRRLAEEAEAGEDEYADAVVKETLRLRPVIPLVVRELQEPMEFGGHLLPAGARVTPCILLMHRREDIYPEANRFRPERFLEQPAGTYTWIPFGGGVRRCLGASFAMFEMKTVLQAVASQLSLSPARPEPERIRRRAITLTPSAGAQVVAA